MRFSRLRTSKSYQSVILFFLLLFVFAAFLGGMRCGSLELSFAGILSTLWHASPEDVNYQILYNIRLPRVLLGGLVGAALAISGAILQGVMRNPLAAPGIIGVSAGGGLAGILIMLVLPQFSGMLIPAAFCGALATALCVYLLAWRRGVNPVRLILSGVAVASMLGAVSSTVLILNAEEVAGILDFTVGSLSARSWDQLHLVKWYLFGGYCAAMVLAHKLNILTLGDEIATGLGVRVERLRFLLLAVSALLAASAVSVVGMLGFVGLIAPHMVRLILGSDYRFLIPGCALFGAGMVIVCDTVGRMVMDPMELPVGVIMSLLGPPFFLYLLRRRRHET